MRRAEILEALFKIIEIQTEIIQKQEEALMQCGAAADIGEAILKRLEEERDFVFGEDTHPPPECGR